MKNKNLSRIQKRILEDGVEFFLDEDGTLKDGRYLISFQQLLDHGLIDENQTTTKAGVKALEKGYFETPLHHKRLKWKPIYRKSWPSTRKQVSGC